jgi:predicted translin family RNA/ssDNA-binding protein
MILLDTLEHLYYNCMTFSHFNNLLLLRKQKYSIFEFDYFF